MKNIYFLFFGIVTSFFKAQIPQYYNNVDFKQSKENVKQQLTYLITQTHHEIGYYDVWNVLKRADEDPNNKNNVLLIYGYENGDETSKYSRTRKKELQQKGSVAINRWNREHVFAKSLASPKLIGTGNTIDAGSDAHNLRAADVRWNSTRNNRIFQDAEGLARIIKETGAWYPGDEWKGDVARIIMYMYVRYGARTKPNVIGFGGHDLYQIPDVPDVFLKWNREDPPSDFEIRRNQEIFYTQTNRNPFIDNPYLATLIWGGEAAKDTWNLQELLNTEESFSKDDNLKVYPAIAQSSTEIIISRKVNSVQVFSMTGALVYQAQHTDKITAPSEKGIYMVKILSKENNKMITKKIIVK